MNSITISIITTVYQAEKDLPRLLDSMMAHQCEHLEFFLIDNAATDRSGDICEEYARKDGRFTVCHLEENIGYIRARNYGIEHCQGTYVGFCDSDDYLESGGYDKAYKEICNSSCDFWLGGYITEIDGSGVTRILPFMPGIYHVKDIQEKMILSFYGHIDNNSVFHGFAWKNVYRRSILMNSGIRFLETLKPYEDQLFNLLFVKQCQKVYSSEVLVYHYIVNSESITAKLLSNFDAWAEWKRTEMLVEEKLRFAENDKQRTAVYNEGFDFIYGIVLNLSKNKKVHIKDRANVLQKICKEQSCKCIVNLTKQTSKINTIILKALSNEHYQLLIWGIQIALKFRGGEKN